MGRRKSCVHCIDGKGRYFVIVKGAASLVEMPCPVCSPLPPVPAKLAAIKNKPIRPLPEKDFLGGLVDKREVEK